MVSLSLKVLGTFALFAGDKPINRFPTDKARALLIYLALEGKRPHLRRSLATLLWPDYDERGSLRNLRKGLYYLRQAIETVSPEAGDLLLSISRQTVEINLTDLCVDAIQFQQYLSAVEDHSHRHLHTCEACVANLTMAVELYEGDLTPGFSLADAPAFEEWLLLRREQLQRQAIVALQNLAVAYEQRGNTKLAERYATYLLRLDPYNETVVRQLMAIQFKTGRRSAAKQTYENLLEVLHSELGVEPEEKTSALFTRIIENDTLEPVTALSETHHFPTQFTPFLGRKSELSQIQALMEDPENRLLTIVGPGGIGKTRLAIEAAKKAAGSGLFPDGIYFANLSAIEHVDLLPVVLATTLDIVSQGGATTEEQLLEFLQVRKCLLVFDNFEQVSGGEDLVAKLLNRAPDLTLLVTSLKVLHLRAERTIRIEGLAFPEQDCQEQEPFNLARIMSYDAVRLFIQSARLVRPDYALTAENIRPIIRITSLTQGLPLALEITASWVRLLKTDTIAEKIEHSLDLLTSPLKDLPERHQSMTSIFDYSWNLLTPEEQLSLVQLSVFRGSFSLTTALAVAKITITDVVVLMDKSLLQTPTTGHYALHELLRQYIQGKFQVLTGGKALELTVRRNHSNHYLNLVANAEKDFYGAKPYAAANMLRQRLSNITQAWNWAVEHCEQPEQMESILCSAAGLGRFYSFLGLSGEGERVMSDALARIESKKTAGSLPEKPFALLSSCLLYWKAVFLNRLGHIDDAIQTAEMALILAEENPSGAAEVKSLLGQMLPGIGQFDRAEACQEEALSFFEKAGDRHSAAVALGRLGVTRWRRANYSQAIIDLNKALGLQEALGDIGAAAELNRSIAGIYYEQEDFKNAKLYVERARNLHEEVGDFVGVARTNGNLALLYQKAGQYELALEFNQKELVIYREIGDLQGVELTFGNRGALYLQMGKLDEAIAAYQEALRLSRKLGLVWNQARSLSALAYIWYSQGDYKQADEFYKESIPVLREHGAKYYVIFPLLGQARIFIAEGQLDKAQNTIEEAIAIAEQVKVKAYIFQSRVMLIRLEGERGNQDIARQRLESMLAATKDLDEQARIHYELWRLDRSEKHAQAAQRIYQKLNAEAPQFEYQRLLAKLEMARL